VSNDQEKIEEVVAAAAIGTAVALTPWQQTVNGVKIAFATKKLAMAAWALFFGVSAVTGAAVYSEYYESGMTADQIAQVKVMEEEVIMLRTEVEELKGIKANHDHEHENDHARGVVIPAPILLPHDHDTKHEHEVKEAGIPEHTHPAAPVIAPVLIPHDHDTAHQHDTTHTHKATDPVIQEVEVVKEVEVERTENGLILDGEWIPLQ